jgi:DNA-binding response OmpR family regulator
MPSVLRVALLGFNAIDRATISAGFRLVDDFVLVPGLDDGALVLADADHAPAVQLVLATDRLADTVFVGRAAPAGAAAWVPRPIDARLLLRELAGLRARRQEPAEAPAAPLVPAPGVVAPTALVVDDSETARQALARRLERWGFAVEVASQSGQALSCLSRRRFDSLFIDVDLGPASVLDGFGLCHRLKRQARPGAGPVPWVALVTGLDGPSDRVRGALAGCDAYIAKPIDATELARVLWREGWIAAPVPG